MPFDPDRLRREQDEIAAAARTTAVRLLLEGNLSEAVRFMDMAARNGMSEDDAYDLLGTVLLNRLRGDPPVTS